MNVDSRIPVGLVMIGIGLSLFIGTGVSTYIMQMTMAEPVDATVESSNVTTIACSVDESCDHRYTASVTYTYTYQSTTYTGDQVFPKSGNMGDISRSWAEDIVNDYPAGEQTTAYILPDNPDTSYLIKTRPNLILVVFFVFGALLALAGANGIRQGLTGAERPEMNIE